MKAKIFFAFIILLAIIISGYFFLQKNSSEKNPATNENFAKDAKIENDDQKLKEMIGQMIIVGFRGTKINSPSEICQTIKNTNLGGVILFDYDVPSESFPRNIIDVEQTKKLVSNLQACSQTPLFVAIDAEGGNVLRLKKDYGFLPILSAQKMAENETTEKEAQKLAAELSELGFNLNFAPVVDVNTSAENPVIGKLERSFSADPKIVFENAQIFIEKMSAKNIISVAKHFPGHGSSAKDSHLGLVDVTKTYSDKELIPYQKLIQADSLDAVMTAHIINKNIDAEYPATLSESFLQDILRNQLGFKGLIISDDMQMGAITKNYSLENSVILAVNAGCNILVASNNSVSGYDKNAAEKISKIIFSAVKDGKISEEKIKESYNLITALKNKFNILK